MPIRFDQLSSAPARALQIYLISLGAPLTSKPLRTPSLPSVLAFSLPRGYSFLLAIWPSGAFTKGWHPSPRWRSLRTPEHLARAILCR